MKKLLLVFIVCSMFSCVKAQKEKEKQQDVTTYYFVRHAEKDKKPANNPRLLQAGKIRAQNYASFFENINLDAIYSTKFTRTLNTAKPTANSKNLNTIIYHPTKIDYKDFLNKTKNKSVLVVGHSNTIPGFVNAIINTNTYNEIDESIYNHMYIVTIINGEINHELKRLD